MDFKAFLDSCIILYAFDEGVPEKSERSFELINQNLIVSPQVLFETLFVLRRKVQLDKSEASNFIKFLLRQSVLQIEDKTVTELALFIFNKYLFQPFDSKIVASALVAGCSTLYSEDMQHGLLIENTLTIVNPFLDLQK